jgi:hypothetical protein
VGDDALYDIRTRKLRPLYGCGSAAFLNASQIACQPYESEGYVLYDVRTRKARTLPCTGLCQHYYDSQNLIAVGSEWFEVEVEPHDPCGDGIHNDCRSTTAAFYNIHTGRQQVPVVSNSETIDLNSATLTRQLCPPLLEPPGYSPTNPIANTLTLDGSFAIAQEPSAIYRERCGSDLHLSLATGVYEGGLLVLPRAAAFCSSSMQGYFLPSLQHFTINATKGALPSTCPILAPRHAYATDDQGHVWAAPLPSKLQDLITTRHHTTS